MTVFDTLKLVHVLSVIISASLFVNRFGRLAVYPEQRLSRPLRVLPHINDTVLLAAAVGMLVILNLNPLSTPWLLAKILALFLYVGFGTICMKAVPGSRSQWTFFVLAVLTFLYIVFVALAKTVLPI